MKNGFLTNLWTSIWGETQKTKYISAIPAVTEANVNICYQRMQQQKQDGIKSTFSGKNFRCHYLCASLQVFSIGLFLNNTKEITSFEYEVYLLMNKLQLKATFDCKKTRRFTFFSYLNISIISLIFSTCFSLLNHSQWMVSLLIVL